MILYFADRHLNILGQATSHLPKGVRLISDLKSQDVETGVSVFEGDIGFDRKTRAKVEKWAEVGNYILKNSDNESELYNIIDATVYTKQQKVSVYAEDDGLDLLNDIAEAYEADQEYPISSYVERFAGGAGWEIGINEVEGLTRKLSWDSEQTVSARLISVAEAFNHCEFSFSFEIKGLQITKKYINIYAKRGKDTGVQLRLNKEIDSIVTTKSIANLATALRARGSTPADSDNPITLLGYEYDDGDFYVDGAVLKSRKALQKWSRFLWKGDDSQQSGGHIVKSYNYDTTSQAVLCEKTIEELKKVCDMEVNYEVDIKRLPPNVKIGDRVNIIDDAGELYLSARLLKLEISEIEQTYKATLGENIIKGSGISQKVADLAQQFSVLAKSRVFYTWIAYADDENGTNITTEPEGKAYIGIAANKTKEDVDISNPSVFTWSKIKGEDGNNGQDGTDGTNGQDGVSSHLHIRYSNDGINFTEKDGTVAGDWMGTCVTESENAPTNFDAYEWHKIKGEQGVPGVDGIGIDGTSSYFHIRYSEVENPTSTSQMTENPSKYIGTYVDHIEDDSDDPKDYKWVQFMGVDGIPGTDGKNGQTYYLHIKYSNDGGKTFTGNNGEDSGEYIGVYTDTTSTDSSNVSSYKWSLIKGEDGIDGKDGVTYYTWIKYADSPTSGMSDSPEGKKYMGLAYNKTSKTESTNYGDYTWSLIKGEDGTDGVNGVNGSDGKTYYTWVKYADDVNGTNMSDDPTNKKYIGLAYNKTTPTESNTASNYQWALFRGTDGVNGKDGKTYYTWIKYADTPTSGMSDNPEGKKYMGLAYNKTSSTESTSYSDYTWSLIKGEDGTDGVNGTNGKDGTTYYTWVKYADDASGTNMTDDPTNKKYIGLAYNKTTSTESTRPSDYQWALFRGIDGVNGTNGKDGADGKDGKDGTSSYFHIRYSANLNGSSMTTAPQSDTEYMGVCSTTSSTAPTSYASYTWSKIKGEQGISIKGDKGDTSYVHIKYSNDGTTFTENNGEELGSWIGILVDYTETDSTAFSDYNWKKFTEDVDEELKELNLKTEDGVAEIVKLNDKLAHLVTDENGTSLMEQTSTGWTFNIGGVADKVDKTADDLNNLSSDFDDVANSVDGLRTAVDDLGQLASYVRVVEENGQPCIELGEGDSDFKVKITNTDIKFMEGSTVVAYISNQALHIEKAAVNEELQIGGFAFKKKSNGNVGIMWKGES